MGTGQGGGGAGRVGARQAGSPPCRRAVSSTMVYERGMFCCLQMGGAQTIVTQQVREEDGSHFCRDAVGTR